MEKHEYTYIYKQHFMNKWISTRVLNIENRAV